MKCNPDMPLAGAKKCWGSSLRLAEDLPQAPITKEEFFKKHNNQVYMLCELAEVILKVENGGPDFQALRDAAHDYLVQYEKLNEEMSKNGVCLG